jgi:hypothetical protein
MGQARPDCVVRLRNPPAAISYNYRVRVRSIAPCDCGPAAPPDMSCTALPTRRALWRKLVIHTNDLAELSLLDGVAQLHSFERRLKVHIPLQ